ncbi:hypothetical protein GCM10027614_35330 [Micromonospora vulcania]
MPGNHEIMGAPISNFQAVFGATSRVFDHAGTRFVTLNSSTGTLRGGGFDQVRMLRDTLDAAAADPRVGSVVVLEHHPARDPSPAQASQLGDRKEAGWWSSGWPTSSTAPERARSSWVGTSAPSTPIGSTGCHT